MQRNLPLKKPKMATISGLAYNFLNFKRIPNAKITILEDPEVKINTDKSGDFKFEYLVGKEVTLVLEEKDFTTTQTFTSEVPPEGFNGDKHIAFQVLSKGLFDLFSKAIGITAEKDRCQIAGTVTSHGKTYHHLPHGLAGIQIEVYRESDMQKVEVPVFYFDIFDWGPLMYKTFPLTRSLKKTTEDGGFLIPNLPEGNYLIVARDPSGQISFPPIKVKARKNTFINLNPPHGPSADKELELEKKPCTERLYNFFKPVLATGVVGGCGIFLGGVPGALLVAAAGALGGPSVVEGLRSSCGKRKS